MVQIQNTDAINAIRDGAKLSVSEGFPRNLLPNVQPVLDMTPDHHRVANIARSLNAAGTFYTTPADRDFYLTVVELTAAHSVADTGTVMYASVVVGGTARLILLAGVNAESSNQAICVPFVPPLKVDRNTAITLVIAGTWSGARGFIAGYEVEQQIY